MTLAEIKAAHDIVAEFDISDEEAERIAESVSSDAEFVSVWENTDWWTDENNQ